MKRIAGGWGPFIVAALVGALAMDYPQTLWPLIFVMLVPLIRYFDTHALRMSDQRAILRLLGKMFVFGIVFSMLSTSWIASTYPLTWINIPDPVLSGVIVAIIWISFGTMLALPIMPWLVLLYGMRTERPLLQALVGASLWILLEYARSWMVAFGAYGTAVLFGPHHTYYSLAYVLSGVPVMRDLFAVGGLYLVSFLVVLTNFFLYYVYRVVTGRTVRRAEVLILGVCIASTVITGSLLMSHIRALDTGGAHFTLSVVNSHLPSSTNDVVAAQKSAAGLDVISRIDNARGVLILPENLDVLNSYLESKNPHTHPLGQFDLVIGSHPDIKMHSMYFFEPATEQGVSYRKQLLMPIGEYSVDWVEYLIRLSRNRAWINGYDTVVQNSSKKGAGISLYKDQSVHGLVFAGSICAENISPYIFRDETRAGATVLTNISSLSPFRNNATLARQTLAIDISRAIENGRYLAVAANDTASFVVRDTGDVAQISNTDTQASAFNTSVQVMTYRTPYVAYGDYTIALAFALLLIAGVWLLI